MHTLVTFLGKGRDNLQSGYRRARYQFGDTVRETTFFGFALREQLQPQTLVVLGTRGSMWGVLVEHLATEGQDEGLYLALLEAAETTAEVDQALLDRVAPLMQRALKIDVRPRLIPYARDAAEQRVILETIQSCVPPGRVSFDLTHGFRHLGMVGLMSAFMLERMTKLDVAGLWYGALDMTVDDLTPVLRLDGLTAIRRWIDALDRFDATGDYGVFAPLLEADGVPADKARSLEEAAFHERTRNLADARRKLMTFLPVLEEPLAGASSLFGKQLRERLGWVRAGTLADQQGALAYLYLRRRDYLRAAAFGHEAVVSRECIERGLDPQDYKRGRKPAAEALEHEFKSGKHEQRKCDAY